jgi:hypothetical protein
MKDAIDKKAYTSFSLAHDAKGAFIHFLGLLLQQGSFEYFKH